MPLPRRGNNFQNALTKIAMKYRKGPQPGITKRQKYTRKKPSAVNPTESRTAKKRTPNAEADASEIPTVAQNAPADIPRKAMETPDRDDSDALLRHRVHKVEEGLLNLEDFREEFKAVLNEILALQVKIVRDLG